MRALILIPLLICVIGNSSFANQNHCILSDPGYTELVLNNSPLIKIIETQKQSLSPANEIVNKPMSELAKTAIILSLPSDTDDSGEPIETFFVNDLISGESGAAVSVPGSYKAYKGTNLRFRNEYILQPQGPLVLVITDSSYLIYNYISGEHIETLDTTTSLDFSTDSNNPRWSPSGRYLAFQANSNKQLKVYDTQKMGQPDATTVVAKHFNFKISGAQWSPDEQFLAITHNGFLSEKSTIYRLSQPLSPINTVAGSNGQWDSQKRFLVSSSVFQYEVFDFLNGDILRVGSVRVSLTPAHMNPEENMLILDKDGNRLSNLTELGLVKLKGQKKIVPPYLPWVKDPSVPSSTQYQRLSEDILLVDANSDFYYVTDKDGKVLLEINRKHRAMSGGLSEHQFLVHENKLYTLSPNKTLSTYTLESK